MTTGIAAIGLDLGSTSIKAGLLDRFGRLNNVVARAAPPVGGQCGRYESDALAYVAAVEQALEQCRIQAGDCQVLGLCSQRSSFLIWEAGSGKPMTPLISWQDSRGQASCDALRIHEDFIRQRAGLPLTPYYFAPKLHVLLQQNPHWLKRLLDGEWHVGMLDAYLVWRWSAGRHFVTDASMAARTLLMDISKQQWSPELCELFGVPLGILPRITPSEGLGLRLENGLLLQAMAGDQSTALLASIGLGYQQVLVNLGTGGFVVRNLTEEIAGPASYLRTLVHLDHRQQAHFAVEGTLNSIVVALEPYPVNECRAEELAQDEIFCIAEPSGLGAPYFVNRRFATCFVDPMHDTGAQFSQPVANFPPDRIAVSLLEGIIFRVARIIEDFQQESRLEQVLLSGGLAGSTCLQQGIAQCVSLPVYRLAQHDSSLLGAVLLAAGVTACPDAERIPVSGDVLLLRHKYARWKNWLDGLLSV